MTLEWVIVMVVMMCFGCYHWGCYYYNCHPYADCTAAAAAIDRD